MSASVSYEGSVAFCKSMVRFLQHAAMFAVLAIAIPSVRVYVCPPVTRWYCVKATARSTVHFALSDGKMCLVL